MICCNFEIQRRRDLLMFLTIMNTLTLQRHGRFRFFYAISHEPSTSLIRSQAQTDPGGYILTILGTTSAFAAGDVQNNGYREAVDGCD